MTPGLRARRTFLEPWYHDFSVLGVTTTQKPGNFQLNQACKYDPIARLIDQALDMCSGDITVLEQFASDGIYSHYAALNGASSVTSVDNHQDRAAGSYLQMEQGILMGRLLGTARKVHFVSSDVHEVQGIYDIGICCGGLYHLEDPMALLVLLRRQIRTAVVLQTVISLDEKHSVGEYFQSPAPNQDWGSRFNLAWITRAIELAHFEIVTQSEGILQGNSAPQDRGSAFFLCRPT